MAAASLALLLARGAAMNAQTIDPEAVKRQALELAQAGDYVEARARLERLVAERPNDLGARKLLARVLIAALAPAEAASHLERVTRADAADAEAWKCPLETAGRRGLSS